MYREGFNEAQDPEEPGRRSAGKSENPRLVIASDGSGHSGMKGNGYVEIHGYQLRSLQASHQITSQGLGYVGLQNAFH